MMAAVHQISGKAFCLKDLISPTREWYIVVIPSAMKC